MKLSYHITKYIRYHNGCLDIGVIKAYEPLDLDNLLSQKT